MRQFCTYLYIYLLSPARLSTLVPLGVRPSGRLTLVCVLLTSLTPVSRNDHMGPLHYTRMGEIEQTLFHLCAVSEL